MNLFLKNQIYILAHLLTHAANNTLKLNIIKYYKKTADVTKANVYWLPKLQQE